MLFSGNYNDLTNKPTIASDISELSDTTNLLFDGNYDSLDNRPVLPTDVSDLTDTTNLFFSRSYADLTNKPTSFSSLSSVSLALGVTIDEFSNDTGMTDNSATALVTEQAVRSFVLDQIGGLSIPTDLTDLSITDGTAGQVLTTNGLGGFTFQDTSNQTGNFTLASSVIDTDDSSTITITPAVVMSSNLTVENDLTVTDNFTVSSSRVEVLQSPFKMASFTTAERDAFAVQLGDVIYNVETGKMQAYVGDSGDSTPGWVDLH